MAPPKKRILKICLQCDKNFELRPSEILKGQGKFCSRSCSMTARQISGGFNLGTGTMRHKDYVLEWAPKHPNNVKGYVYQHRLRTEAKINRYLDRREIVHHKNHIRGDNRISNLELTNVNDHFSHHGTFVEVGKEKLNFTRACRKIGVDRSSAKRLRKYWGFTHQQTIDYYICKRGLEWG